LACNANGTAIKSTLIFKVRSHTVLAEDLLEQFNHADKETGAFSGFSVGTVLLKSVGYNHRSVDEIIISKSLQKEQ